MEPPRILAVDEKGPPIHRIIVVCRQSVRDGPMLLLTRAMDDVDDDYFNDPDRSERMWKVANGLWEGHMQAHGDILLPAHCLTCGCCLAEGTSFVAVFNAKMKCCADCHLDEEGTTLFIGLTCRKKQCYGRPGQDKLAGWMEFYMREGAPGGVDLLPHFRACGWCTRFQFATDSHGRDVPVAPGDDKMMLCGQCRKVYYCNRGCQVKAWATHKLVCDS